MSIGNDPAFATAGIGGLPNGQFLYGQPGLTKRELFAAVALQGMLSHNSMATTAYAAHVAVQAADALIAALEREVQ